MPSLRVAFDRTTFAPSLDPLIAGVKGVGHVGQCIISRRTASRETSAGRATDRLSESLPARTPSTRDTH